MSQKKNLPQSPCPYKGHSPSLLSRGEHVNLQVYMYHLEPHIMGNYYLFLLFRVLSCDAPRVFFTACESHTFGGVGYMKVSIHPVLEMPHADVRQAYWEN